MHYIPTSGARKALTWRAKLLTYLRKLEDRRFFSNKGYAPSCTVDNDGGILRQKPSVY